MSDYTHIDVFSAQTSKKSGMPSGDVIAVDRSNMGTTVICADGIGSGIRARIAAQMCVSHLYDSLRRGISLRKVFSLVAAAMQNVRDPNKPFAAFSIARIRSDGNATVLSYDAPLPILVSRQGGSILTNWPFPLPGGLAVESNCHLENGEGILLMSDGITQAGIGYGAASEWTTAGVIRYINEQLVPHVALSLIPEMINKEAILRWNGWYERSASAIPGLKSSPKTFSPFVPDKPRVTVPAVRGVGDDCSITLAVCRAGQMVTILTGPSADRDKDQAIVQRFLQFPGTKVVCGGTTAQLVAKHLNVPLAIESEPMSHIAPPRYVISGINLVTEGAVTLNQVYNIMDEDVSRLNEDSGVSELRLLLDTADKLNFIVGAAENDANEDISFRQRGVLSRKVLIPLLADKLRQRGKLVNVEFV